MTKEFNGHSNPGYVGDGAEYDKSKLSIELTEKGQGNKQNVYNPYEHRKVAHPTT